MYFGLSTIVAAWLWQSWGGPEVTRLVDNLASLIGIFFAVGCAGWAAYYSEGRMRRGWLAMTGGLFAWATGEAIWFSYEQLLRYEQTPFPSWADAAYLLFYGGAGVAVLLLSTTDHAQSWTRVVLDGLIIAGSAFLISWVAVVNKVFEAGADSGLALAVSMAYPLGDVAIITIVWARGVAAYRPSLGLLVAGLLVIALSDSAYAAMTTDGTYYTGHFVDLGWILGCGLIGMAALRSVGESLPHRRLGPLAAQVRLWGPYLPLVVAAAVALHEAVPALGSAPLAGAMVFIVVAVLARQFIVLAENRQLLNHVSRLAFRDQLTGLANRALFLDRVEQAVARHNRDVEPFAVLCLDLDDFKMVNDELGHPAGDELLVRVARRLSGCLRSTDTIARFGGDEFAVLITGAPDEALVAAERILDAFTEPVAIDGITLTVQPSIGLTFATSETSPATVDDLLRHADLAMYAAKRDGGGCLRSFVPDLPDPFEIPRATASSVKSAASH
ncbi:MAG TPA: GGDEF domain-containing protein, partial [Mycobacterium sp.]|nr:GGDEF domain-containing protein [Mycobacterium sp.]